MSSDRPGSGAQGNHSWCATGTVSLAACCRLLRLHERAWSAPRFVDPIGDRAICKRTARLPFACVLFAHRLTEAGRTSLARAGPRPPVYGLVRGWEVRALVRLAAMVSEPRQLLKGYLRASGHCPSLCSAGSDR